MPSTSPAPPPGYALVTGASSGIGERIAATQGEADRVAVTFCPAAVIAAPFAGSLLHAARCVVAGREQFPAAVGRERQRLLQALATQRDQAAQRIDGIAL